MPVVVILTVSIVPVVEKIPELLLPSFRVKVAAYAAVGVDRADMADTAIAPITTRAEPFLI